MDSGAVFSTPARAVSWGEARCATPLIANASAGVANVDLVGGVDPVVAWQAGKELLPFSAGNPDGHSCRGDECASGNAGGPACLTHPCRQIRYALAPTDYANRTIRLMENLGGIAPSEGPAAGGTRVTFSGEGFLPPSSGTSYICAFSTPGKSWSLSFDAAALPGHESSRLVCETPEHPAAWGTRFPGVVSLSAPDVLAVAELLRRDWPTSLMNPLLPPDASPASATVLLPPLAFLFVCCGRGEGRCMRCMRVLARGMGRQCQRENNQREHRTLHVQKDVLPYAGWIRSPLPTTNGTLLGRFS